MSRHQVRRLNGDQRRTPDRGAAAAEFALVLPLLLTLLFGMFDGARMMLARSMLSYAVEKGARVAALRATPDVAAVRSAVASAGQAVGLDPEAVSVTVNGGATTFAARDAGDVIRVSMTHPWRPAVSFVFPSAGVAMAASSETTVE